MINSGKNIEKARDLYLKKGVLKRELLRDEIVYSWVRSRLVNLDPDKPSQASVPDKSDLNHEKIVQSLYLHDFGLELNSDKLKSILLLNSDGEIINVWSANPSHRYYFNFNEDSIGTSGIGLAIKNKIKSYALGYEHYHQYLIDTLTIGIPTSDNFTIGFVLKMDHDAQKDLQLISRLPEYVDLSMLDSAIIESVEDTQATEGQLSWPACLTGDSEAIRAARDRINQFKDSQLIFISGPKGIGKESTASFLHHLRLGGAAKFHAVYCDKIPLQRFKSEWLQDSEKLREKLDVYDIGTVYFENFDVLPGKYQRKLLRILDSKLVNTNCENGWHDNDTSFILSLTRSVDETKVGTRLTNALQSRLKLAEISLPGLTKRKEDICPILGHMITAEINSSDAIAEIEKSELYDVVKGLELRSNLRDLDHISQDVAERVSESGTLTSECIAEITSAFRVEEEGKVLLRSLSEIEKEAIDNTLKALNFNMVRTAATLGISRSTLYRKLEQHQISIEGVRE